MTTTATSEPSRVSAQPSVPATETSATPPTDAPPDASLGSLPVTTSAMSNTPSLAADHNDVDEGTDETTNSLEQDRPSFSDATISVIIQLLPDDNHADGRLALIAVKSHNLPPLMSTQRLTTLGPFPPSITTLLQQWETALPNTLSERERTRAKTLEIQRLKAAEHKAHRATLKRPESKKPEKSKPIAPVTTPTLPSAGPSPNPTNPESQPDLF